MTIAETHEISGLLTVGEVAARLRVSRPTVYRRIAAGEIPVLRLGSGPRAPLRVDGAELETWLCDLARAPQAAESVAVEAPAHGGGDFEAAA